MKRLIILVSMLAIAFSASSMKKGPRRSMRHNCIYVISMENELFNFKSDRDVAGAAINVYDHKSGAKVASYIIRKKKMIIDMSSQEPGDYIILITKGEFRRKYVFHKQ